MFQMIPAVQLVQYQHQSGDCGHGVEAVGNDETPYPVNYLVSL